MTALARYEHLPALSAGSLQAYIESVQQIPVLTQEQEVALFERFQEENDLEAARQIVLSHLRYVVYIARNYTGYGLPLEDLIQQGNVGLMKSVKRFDLGYGVRLVSFAVHWIKAEIHEYILKNWRLVKIATTKAQRKLFFNLRKAKERLGWFTREEVDRVADDLGVRPDEVIEMESRLANYDESFELPADEEDDSTSGPSTYLTVGYQEDPAWVAEDDEVSDRQSDGLSNALRSLDPRSRDIVESRWLSDKKMGLKELAERYGVSLERIRQIEAKAFEKMQPYIEETA